MNNPVREIERKIEGIIRLAPRAIGPMARDHFKMNFRNQAFDTDKWARRNRESKKSRGRAILVKSGRLWRSIRVVRADTGQVVIGTDVAYARIHNEGGTINQAARSELFTRNRYVRGAKKGALKKGTQAGKGFTYKARTIRIPQRRFMGDSPLLQKKMDTWYLSALRSKGIIK